MINIFLIIIFVAVVMIFLLPKTTDIFIMRCPEKLKREAKLIQGLTLELIFKGAVLFF